MAMWIHSSWDDYAARRIDQVGSSSFDGWSEKIAAICPSARPIVGSAVRSGVTSS